jgi:hypothetical protein
MRASFGDQTKVRNVHGLLQASLVGSVEDGIERNLRQYLVNTEFMRIEDHDASEVEQRFELGQLWLLSRLSDIGWNRSALFELPVRHRTAFLYFGKRHQK